MLRSQIMNIHEHAHESMNIHDCANGSMLLSILPKEAAFQWTVGNAETQNWLKMQR